MAHGTPRAALLPQPILNSILADENGAILRSTITFVLEDRLKDLLVRPRFRADGTMPVKSGPKVKYDHYHHLFFCFQWLNDGLFHRTRESIAGWGSVLYKKILFIYY